MKRTKTFARAFSGLTLIAISAVFFLLAGCSGCNCPPCQTNPIKGGGTTPVAIGGTVLEEFVTGTIAQVSGDSVYCVSGAFSVSDTTKAGGVYGVDTILWDGTSQVTYLAYKNTANSFDEIIYNKLGQTPYTDLQNDTFIYTTPGTTIPVIVIAQKGDRTPHAGATVQIKDSGLHLVGTAGTTDLNGICTYGTQLNPGSVYWLYVSGPGIAATHFQFTTSAPTDAVTGTMCRLRIFARY